MTTNYETYVNHPRYGRGPRFTGVDPDIRDPNIQLHWNATSGDEIKRRYEAITGEKWPFDDIYIASIGRIARIPGTATPADLSRQTRATVPVTHYYDLERTCRDCKKPFIFYAEEQKHWYEELGFGLDSDCVRCVVCRKRQKGLSRQRKRYEELFHTPNRSDLENLEMADCCLSLIETSIFSPRQTQLVRMLLNQTASHCEETNKSFYDALRDRVRAIETRDGEDNHTRGRPNRRN